MDGSENRSNRPCRLQRKWISLAASAFCAWSAAGLGLSLGVLYVEFLEAFGKTRAATVIVQSVGGGMIGGASVISGVLISIFGTRSVGISGGVLISGGLAISYFATGVPFLIGSIGIISGLGMSLLYMSATTSTVLCFHGKAKLLAVAITTAAGGVGAMSVPYIMQAFIDEYAWRGALLVLGGMFLNSIPAALLFYPSVREKAVSAKSEDATLRKAVAKKCWSIKGIFNNGMYIFVSITIASNIGFLVSAAFVYMDYISKKGFESSSGVFIIMLNNALSALGRFLPGVLKQVPNMSSLILLTLTSLLGGVSMLMLSFSEKYVVICIVAAGCGFAHGLSLGTLPVALAKLVGDEMYSIGFGASCTAFGLLITISSVLAGVVRDAFGSYDVWFFIGGGCMLITSLLCSLTYIGRKCRHGSIRQSEHSYDFTEQDYSTHM